MQASGYCDKIYCFIFIIWCMGCGWALRYFGQSAAARNTGGFLPRADSFAGSFRFSSPRPGYSGSYPYHQSRYSGGSPALSAPAGQKGLAIWIAAPREIAFLKKVEKALRSLFAIMRSTEARFSSGGMAFKQALEQTCQTCK